MVRIRRKVQIANECTLGTYVSACQVCTYIVRIPLESVYEWLILRGSPWGCGWLGIPGVSQVEKGEHHHRASLFTPGTAINTTILL